MHNDGTNIAYDASDKSYIINQADGSMITKSGDGSYTILLSSGDNIAYQADGTYVNNTASGTTENGKGKAELNKYLKENDYPTLDDYDKQVQDILDYIKENK